MTKYCKVKLDVSVVFRSEKFKKSNDKRNISIKSKNGTDIDEIFSQLIRKHEELPESLKNINLIPEGIESITYNFTEIVITNTFIETPQWPKNKTCTISPQNNDNKCFQYSLALSLYHEQIGRNSFRLKKIKPYVNNFNWKNINFPPQEQDYKIFEMNIRSIALNILQQDGKKNKSREKQAILLIITDCQKQHYVFVKNLNSLLKPLNHSDNYYLNCLKPFRTKSRLKNIIIKKIVNQFHNHSLILSQSHQ